MRWHFNPMTDRNHSPNGRSSFPRASGEATTGDDEGTPAAIADEASTVAAPLMAHRSASPPDPALRASATDHGARAKGWFRLVVLLLGVLLGAGGWYAWRHTAIAPGAVPVATTPLTVNPQSDSAADGATSIDSNDPDTNDSNLLTQDDNTAEGGNAIVFNAPTPRPTSRDAAGDANNEDAQTTHRAATETTDTSGAVVTHQEASSSGDANTADGGRSQTTDTTHGESDGSQTSTSSTIIDEGTQRSEASASADRRPRIADGSKPLGDHGQSVVPTPPASEPPRAGDTTSVVTAHSPSTDTTPATRDRSQSTDTTTATDARAQATDASSGRAQASDVTVASNERARVTDATRPADSGAETPDTTPTTTTHAQPTQATRSASTAGANETADRIAALIASAERDIARLRLTSPPGNNAFEKLRDVQRLDAQNEAATVGLERIVARYFELVDRAASRDDYDAALDYLERAEGVLPNHQDIPSKRTLLQQARQQALARAATAPTPAMTPVPTPVPARPRPLAAPAMASAPATTTPPSATPPAAATAPTQLRIGIYPNETIVPCYHSVGGRVTDRAQGIAALRNDVDVAFDYYHASGAINTVGRPEQVWSDNAVNKRPRVNVVTRSARRLELDAVLMGWYDCSESQHVTDDTYSLDLFLVDVSTGQVYEANVPLLQSSQAVSSLMAQLLKARGRQ